MSKLALFGMGALLSLASCYNSKNEEKGANLCNSKGNLLTRGEYQRCGIDGFRLGDHDDFSLASCPNFEYYDNHRGGSGNTLDFVNDDNSIWLSWSFGKLTTVAVREGWMGKTERGIGVGDDLSLFVEQYPEARKRETYFKDPEREIWATGYFRVSIDKRTNSLIGMQIDRTTNYDDDLNGPVNGHIGPSYGSSPWY